MWERPVAADGFSKLAMQTALSVPRRRRGLKLRSSTKLVLGAVVLGGLVWGGWTYGVGAYVLSKHFALLKPGKFSLIGLKTGHGFTIQVSNRVAHLVESKDTDFRAAADDQAEAAQTEGAAKKRLPIKEMMASLQGDEAALSTFVASLSDLAPKEDWPPGAPVWEAGDIQKALDGNPAERAKLLHDLNVDFNGKPLDVLSTSALENGIIVETPVPVHVQVGGEQRVLHARIKRWYQPAVMMATNEKFKDLFNVTNQQKAAYYVQAVKEQSQPEDVTGALKRLIDPAGLADAAARAEMVLSSAFVVLTDKQVESASYRPSEVGNSDLNAKPDATGMFDLDLHVNDEGRMRLWQYSKLHPYDQLLLVSNGVAIAAPRIRHELVSPDLTIVQMPDEGLLKEAVDMLNKK
ncbi:MAG: hypothetical protein ACYC96_00080 [Fimbriimonadaceae bacterium]